MTFYQELQLNQAGSKNYVAGFRKPKEKLIHILIFIFKVLLNIAFSIAVVMLLSLLFGYENSIAGLVVLLGISTFRFTDLDMRATHSVGGIFLIFLILAVGPKAANLAPTGCDLLVNFLCILLIVILGCHNVKWFNHSILVVSYLLLYGSDVSGFSYVKRLICLLLGATLTSLVLYRNRRKTEFKNGFKDIVTDFCLSDARSRWQIKIALCVSGAVFIAALAGFPKVVWAGIAAASVTVPVGDIKERVEGRIRGNMIAEAMFILVSVAVPVKLVGYLSTVGGFGAGFCGKYEGQTAWNAFSAMAVAASVIGVYPTIIYRLLNNVLGALFAFAFGTLTDCILSELNGLLTKKRPKRPKNKLRLL